MTGRGDFNTRLTRARLSPAFLQLWEVLESREASARFFNRVFAAAGYFGYLRGEPEVPDYS